MYRYATYYVYIYAQLYMHIEYCTVCTLWIFLVTL